jgi:hypothetical protein
MSARLAIKGEGRAVRRSAQGNLSRQCRGAAFIWATPLARVRHETSP